jgi:MFS family permease
MTSRTLVIKAAIGLAIGLFITWAALQSLVFRSGMTLELWVVALVVVGCVVLASAVVMSPLPDAIVRRSAYMWGSSIFVRAAIAFGFAGLPAIVWAIAVISVLRTRPR